MVGYICINSSKNNKGFTLVEVLVATALFVMVVTVALGALMSAVYANRTTQAIHVTYNNLHSAVDSMVRNVRMGSVYHCGSAGDLSMPQDCTSAPEAAFAYREYGSEKGSYTMYYVKNMGNYNSLFRKKVDKYGNLQEDIALTSPDIHIEEFRVYVRGSSETDDIQPFVTFLLKGSVGVRETVNTSLFGQEKKIQTKFLIQSAAVQRLLDI